MVKFINVFCFVWFTVFLVFWGVRLFTNNLGNMSPLYVGIMFFSHIGLSALYLYKILKNLKGEDI